MPIPTRLPNGRALIESGSDSAPALTLPDAAPITHGDLRAAAARTGRQLGPVKQLALIVADGSAEAMVGYISVLASGHAALLVADTSPAFIREIVNAYRPNWLGSQLPGGWALRPESGAPLALHPELAVMLSTSGSTGAVKFVRLSYTNVIENARSIADYLELNASDRGLLTLPIHYSFGLSVLNSHLLSGASVLASPHALTDPALWGFFKREGGTSFAGVPHSYKLLDAIDFENLELPTLRTMTQAGGRLPRDTALKYAALAERKGFRFFLMYGQTEATARMAYVPPDEARRFPDCVGVPIPRGALHLIAADGSPITRAETEGELVYTGPNVMMGYATHLADLAAPPGPRELKTGDLAVLNEHGLVRITGRKSRFLKLFGLRISLDEIERKLEAQGIRAVCTGDANGSSCSYRERSLAPRSGVAWPRWPHCLPAQCMSSWSRHCRFWPPARSIGSRPSGSGSNASESVCRHRRPMPPARRSRLTQSRPRLAGRPHWRCSRWKRSMRRFSRLP